MFRVLLMGLIGAMFSGGAAVAQFGPVQMAILPNARSAAPNEPVTFFATMVNSSETDFQCAPRFGGFFAGLPGGASGRAQFFEVENGTIVGSSNAPTTVPAGGSTDFVVEITIDRAYSGSLTSIVQCTAPGQTANIPRIPIVNDFQVVIATGNQPDIITIGDTLTNDGVARVGETGPRAALMTVAAVNIGDAGADLVVVPEIAGFSALNDGYRPTVCETDAAGTCLAPESFFVRVPDWAANETRFFAVRARVPASTGIPNYPADLRLTARIAQEPPGMQGRDSGDYAPGLNQLLDAMFGGHSSAVEARPQPAAIETPPDDFLGPVQQCSTRLDSDSSAEWARAGGIILVESDPDSDQNRIRGFYRSGVNRFSPDYVDQPVATTIPRLGMPQVANLDILGGPTTSQASDAETSVTIDAVDGGGLVIRWTGNANVENEFGQPGRIRCAPVPAQPDQDNDGTGTNSLDGRYVNEAFQAADFEAEIAERRIYGRADRELFEYDLDRRPADNVALAFQEFWLALSLGAGSDRAGVADTGSVRGFIIPVRTSQTPDGPQTDCFVFMADGTPLTPEQGPETDAGVYTFVRDGVTVDDIETCRR
ncbi:MAG: hypothetical protein GC208_05545 [Alphaproteobacteria bacterium]|nr:hypothetical protein [Alphaproteobacteria bacterium]